MQAEWGKESRIKLLIIITQIMCYQLKQDFLRRKALFEKNCILTKDASKFDSEAVEGEEIKNFNNLRRKSTIHG